MVNEALLKKILEELSKETFLATLEQPRRIAELSDLSLEDKQRLIFLISVRHAKSIKKAEEIFMVMKAILPNDFFTLPHYSSGEDARGVLITTALHWAADIDCGKEVIDLILQQGIHIDRLDFAGGSYHTAMDVAIVKGNEKSFDALLAAGANIVRDANLAQAPWSAPLIRILFHSDDEALKEKLLRMTQKLITAGANPNVRFPFDKLPALMNALGFRPHHPNNLVAFNKDFSQQLLSSPKLDLTSFYVDLQEMRKITALDFVTSYDNETKELLEARQLLQDYIRDRFANRLVDVEIQMKKSVAILPRQFVAICSEYACADEGFEKYGNTEKSMAFLYNITKDRIFLEKVKALRKPEGVSDFVQAPGGQKIEEFDYDHDSAKKSQSSNNSSKMRI